MSRDPEHWLWRLSAAQWLAAGDQEIRLAADSADSRRRAVTHARRGAGMGLNAVLVHMASRGWSDEECETRWGRSYIDHLRRVRDAADPSPLAPVVAAAIGELLAIDVVPGGDLVQLVRSPAGPGQQAAKLAAEILAACSHLVDPA